MKKFREIFSRETVVLKAYCILMLRRHSSVPLQVQAPVQTFHSGSFSQPEKSVVVVTIEENNQTEHCLLKKDLFAVMRKKQS